jgi:hypothetical protein
VTLFALEKIPVKIAFSAFFLAKRGSSTATLMCASKPLKNSTANTARIRP